MESSIRGDICNSSMNMMIDEKSENDSLLNFNERLITMNDKE